MYQWIPLMENHPWLRDQSAIGRWHHKQERPGVIWPLAPTDHSLNLVVIFNFALPPVINLFEAPGSFATEQPRSPQRRPARGRLYFWRWLDESKIDV